MAEVRVPVTAPNLGPHHEKAPVLPLDDVPGLEGLREARPSRARFELVFRAKKGLPGDYVHVYALLLVVPVLVVKGPLCALLLRHAILKGREPFPYGLVVGFLVSSAIHFLFLYGFYF